MEEVGETRGIDKFVFFTFIIILMFSMISAGWFEDFKKVITGEATKPVTVNISVGKPEIRYVYNTTAAFISAATGLSQGPLGTSLILNFTAYLTSGTPNLNHSTAGVNFTIPGLTRQNTSCATISGQSTANLQNYTCNVTMWWWYNSTTWSITAFVKDNTTNIGTNSSMNFTVGSTTAFDVGPTALTWPGISPGATNQTSDNDPMTLNNSGNQAIGISSGNISVNATNLFGETTGSQALWARNFSIGLATGGTSCVGAACTECAGTFPVQSSNYTNISSSTLPTGNYTINDGTAQEQLWYCVILVGAELSNQQYSTAANGSWIVQIS